MERTENPKIKYHIYIQLIFDKGSKAMQWGKKFSFQQMVLGWLDTIFKRMKFNLCLTPYNRLTQNGSKT